MPGTASYKGYCGYTSESEYEPSANSSSPITRQTQPTSYSSEPEDIYNANSESEETTPTGRHRSQQKPAQLSSDDIPLSTHVVRRQNGPHLSPTQMHGTAHYAIGQPLPPLFGIQAQVPLASASTAGDSDRTLAASGNPVSVSGHVDIHSPGTERRILAAKKSQKRLVTVASNRSIRILATQTAAEEAKAKKAEVFKEALAVLETGDCTLAEFLEYVFNPSTSLRFDWRWKGFFNHKSIVRQIFAYWTSSSYSRTARQFVDQWAIERVGKIAGDEAKEICDQGVVSRKNREVDENFFLDFSIPALTSRLESIAPSFFHILSAFSTTARQGTQLSAEWLAKKRTMIGSAVLTLLQTRSQNNNYSQSVCGTYLLATGAQRQHFGIFNALGTSASYGVVFDRRRRKASSTMSSSGGIDDEVDNSVVGTNLEPTAKKKRSRTMGLLSRLSMACRKTTRIVAGGHLYIIVYDNINMMVRIAEQVLGRKNAQENGTCATVLPLFKAELKDLDAQKFNHGVKAAKPLAVEDLELTTSEAELLDNALGHTIASIIVKYGGDSFSVLTEELEKRKPVSSETIEVHTTSIHPLPSMEIDESTITGNVHIMEAINRELQGPDAVLDDASDPKYVQMLSGDQLTMQRQRSVATIRAGHEVGLNSWKHIVLVPGLFHAKIADCHGLLITHFGVSSIRSPGSLAYHNTCLDRIPIILTSLPSFRVCRDLIMISLYARVLHCLLLVSETTSLEEYLAQHPSVDNLLKFSHQIIQQFANANIVQQLREPREIERRKQLAKEKAENDRTRVENVIQGDENNVQEAENLPAGTKSDPKSKAKMAGGLRQPHNGDEVFENAQLFLRDALFTRLFADAVKAGDSGMVVVVLKIWTMAYRGSGRSKYTHEMLHLFQNLVNVWSKELRAVVLNNWLVNPTGKPNAFVELDLVQEHLNFWIKKVYRADGDAHSWEWLEVVSPCIEVLRKLSKKLNSELGSKQGSKHTTPDLQNDIKMLMNVLHIHKVYEFKKGRMVDAKDVPVPDILATGWSALTHASTGSSPLREFNIEFKQIQARRNLIPVDLAAMTSDAAPHAPDATTSPTESGPGIIDTGDDASIRVNELEMPSPTLTRLDAMDVDLDMDEFLLEDDFDEEEDVVE